MITPNPSSAGPAQVAPARILVVEDERIVAMGLQAKLESLGYCAPTLCTTGADAIAAAERERPDLVLMDISLDGDMDGIEAARHIRARLRIPVVYLTAYSNREILERAKETSPLGYILKPYEDRELEIVVAMAVHRQRLERKLREQERLFEATLRSIGDGVIATDAAGCVTFLNCEAERLTGWQQQDALGRSIEEVFQLVDELTRETIASPLRSILADSNQVPSRREAVLQARDGRRVPVDDTAAPILGEAGEVLGAVQIFRDATQQRTALRTASRLASIITASDDAIVSKTLQGIITSWNPAAERLYGYSAAEAIGQPCTILSPVEGVAEMLAGLEKIKRGATVPPTPTVRQHKDGKQLQVLLSLSPLKDEQERVIGVTSITRDITHVRQLEQQFQQGQKMEAIGRLAGGVAHQFNNQLTIINGYTSLVLANLPVHDKNVAMLEQVARAGKQATALTQQLLAYGRKQRMQLKVVDLNELVEHSVKLLQRLIEASIKIDMALTPYLPQVMIDPSQIEQVVMSLAVNARDAMPDGGVLSIATGTEQLRAEELGAQVKLPPGLYAAVRIRDTGHGMDEATLAHLFEPFFTTKDLSKGFGMGLATVYGIVQQSGGHIKVESEVNQGSCFTICLPVVEAPQPQPQKPTLSGLPGGHEVILLVEDEDGVRKLTAHLLRQSGYTLLEAADGEQALQIVEQHQGKIDLLLTDVVMPRLNGPQVAAAVRRQRPEIKVIFQSGYMDESLQEQGVADLERNFIQKPFSIVELARKVRAVLDER